MTVDLKNYTATIQLNSWELANVILGIRASIRKRQSQYERRMEGRVRKQSDLRMIAQELADLEQLKNRLMADWIKLRTQLESEGLV